MPVVADGVEREPGKKRRGWALWLLLFPVVLVLGTALWLAIGAYSRQIADASVGPYRLSVRWVRLSKPHAAWGYGWIDPSWHCVFDVPDGVVAVFLYDERKLGPGQ